MSQHAASQHAASQDAATRATAADLPGEPIAAIPFSRLAMMFAGFYFVQGLGEPTEGLLAQPVRSLLMQWGQDAAQIGGFMAVLALPWAAKPLYGLVSDFLPLAGYRRKSYLVLTSLLVAVPLVALAALPLDSDRAGWLWLLLLPSVGLAFSDVVVDGLMVQCTQPRGWTGQIQAVQWTALFAASAIAGRTAGYMSEAGMQRTCFLVCGLAGLLTLGLALSAPEKRAAAGPAGWPQCVATLRTALATPQLLAMGAFLFLWTFNPFSTTVLHVYMTRELGMSENFFGETQMLIALASIAGTLGYGFLRGRIQNFRPLLHASIVLGILSTAAYAGLHDTASARVISLLAGLTTMLAVLIQLDLAAQVCPIAAAGTVFALLMALSNLGGSLSGLVGGHLYEAWRTEYGAAAAFRLLVATGCAATAACWLVMPALRVPERRAQDTSAG